MTDAIRQQILTSTQLPSLPAVAIEVLDLAQQAEVDVDRIAKTISRDPALSAKILKTINSSFYARRHAVATVSQALVMLGLQSVKTLVLGFSLVPTLAVAGKGDFDRMKYWRRSLHAASAARILANRAGLEAQQEEVFLATLLADVGVLVLDRVLGKEYATVHARAASHVDLSKIEIESIGCAHAEVAALLVESWKLPPILVEPIAFHHEPARATAPPLVKISEIVGLAGRCGDIFVDAEPAPAVREVRVGLTALLAITPQQADALLVEIGTSTRETAKLFEINLGSAAFDLGAALRRANEALVEISLQSNARASELAEQNAALTVKATTDRLTGLANRAQFEDLIAAEFTTVERPGRQFALVMVDVDKFKSVNDRFGHDAGDAVLAHVGAVLRGLTRPTDLAARYGGEELVLLLRDTPRAIAAQVAERVRAAIASAPAWAGANQIPITISAGVACVEPGSPFKLAAHLIKAADLAMYKAKHSGRNNVKVFTLAPAARAA